MTRIKKIKTFNSILESFLKQLIPIIGSSNHHYFCRVIKINSLLPIQKFAKYGLKYKKKIMEKDESYFENKDNHKDVLQDHNDKLSEILRLKDIYYNLDEESKKNVWSIFQALLILTEEYIELGG
tara:strand:- start:68 stop:442 length:375 start_codon:yes stop_codon:yes gene_type:complete